MKWTHQATVLTTSLVSIVADLSLFGKTLFPRLLNTGTWITYWRQKYNLLRISLKCHICETLRRKLCRIIGQLGEPTMYLVHFLYIKENMGQQTLQQNCRPCVLFPLSFHSIHWLLFQQSTT
jgi:hypothetical protein